MNFSSILGFGIAAWVLWAGVFAHAATPAIFLDSHAMILVVGGTTAAGLIAFPIRRFIGLFKLFIFGLLFKGYRSQQALVREIIAVAATAYTQPHTLSGTQSSHPFLNEGYRMIGENYLGEHELEAVLKKRAKYFRTSYMADAKMLNSLAKFPPAFGLLGATTGMIAMMTGLGKGGEATIGPSMAIALVATFWGIAVANLILLPLADYAAKVTQEDFDTRQLIIEGLMCIKRRLPPKEIEEHLNSYLGAHERIRVQRNHAQLTERAPSDRTQVTGRTQVTNSNKGPKVS